MLKLDTRLGRQTWLPFCVLVVAGCIWSTPVWALDQVTLQLKWKHQFQSAGYYAAIEQGYYQEAGLEVVLREAEAGQEPAEVVLHGDAEFGVATSDLVLLRSQGEPVVILAPIFQHSPLVFLVPQNSGVSSIHDLASRPVMIESHATELLAYLEYEGISSKQIEIVPHTFNPSALMDGSVVAMSAYSTDEPFLLASNQIDYLTFTPRAAGIDFYGDTVFTTEEQIRDNPERVKRFLAATLKGWEYALSHEREVVDLILTKYSQRHSREHLLFEAEMTKKLILPDVVAVGYTHLGRWRHIANTYARMGMMPEDVSLDGFLFAQEEKPDYSRFYVALGIALFVIGVLIFVVVRFSRLNAKIRKQADSLTLALSEIKVLKGIIPICANCKNVRDDQGYWKQVESYISTHTEAEFSHGICPVCVQELYPDFYQKQQEGRIVFPPKEE